MKKLINFIIKMILIFLSIASCYSFNKNLVGNPSVPGKNYFDPTFECKKGFLKKEENLVYLKIRDEIRKQFPKPEKKPFLLMTGESTIALFAKDIYEKIYTDYYILNRAIGGETTLLYLLNLEEDIISLKPDVILISIGGNDLLEGRCLSIVVNNLNIILFKIKSALPDTYIIFAGIPPVLSWKINSISPIYNQKVQELLKHYPKTIYFDMWAVLADEDKPHLAEQYIAKKTIKENEEIYDYIHFNSYGYEKIAIALKPILERINKEINK